MSEYDDVASAQSVPRPLTFKKHAVAIQPKISGGVIAPTCGNQIAKRTKAMRAESKRASPC
ncbi:MAG: hypothetical protein NTX56_13045 [Proteobacteria bacterium]|nr:hypothetical protein [Pseudomonadota bacterium]